jgi:hypothetical protein
MAEIEELIDRDTAGHSGRYRLNSEISALAVLPPLGEV